MSNHAKQFQELCNNVSLHDVDFLGCPEINLDTTQQEVKRKLQSLTKAAFSHSSLQLRSSPVPAKHFYKPGGTMCLAQGSINSRNIAQVGDKYG
eukprot:2691564-Ditylum_brightwellii.AAC.1